jgi:hypothetical protein
MFEKNSSKESDSPYFLPTQSTTLTNRAFKIAIPMKTYLLLLLPFSLVMSSCSTVGKSRVPYLSNTDQLQKSPDESRAMVWRSPVPIESFGGFKIEPMQFVAKNSAISEEEQLALKERLMSALNERFAALKLNKTSSKQPTLIVRGAVTAVEKANVPINIIAEAVLNFPVDMGGVAIDLEAVSSKKGERVAAGQYVVPGRPWQLFRSLTELGQARHGMDVAAENFYSLVTVPQNHAVATATATVAKR